MLGDKAAEGKGPIGRLLVRKSRREAGPSGGKGAGSAGVQR